MTRLSWYKRYPVDFRDGTRRLSFEERGFYGDVLDLIYETGDDLPDDDEENAWRLRCDVRTYRRLKARLVELGKLLVDAGRLRNPRAIIEASAAASRIASTVEAGKASAHKRRKSAPKPGNFNGSGGTPVAADVQTDGPAGVQQVSGIRNQSTENILAAAVSYAPAPAREETAPAGPAAAAADDAPRLIVFRTGCDEAEATATWATLLRFAGGDEDLAYYGLHRALRKGRDVLDYAGSVIRGELAERSRPAQPPPEHVDVLALAKRMAAEEGTRH